MSQSTAETSFTLQREGAIAHIRFSRPQVANSMNAHFWREFPRTVEELDRDGSVLALVISGEGKHFSSGMDVAAFGGSGFRPEDGPAEREAFYLHVKYFQRAISAVATTRFPVIAAIQGACIGGALDLVSACDLRFAAADAYFRIEEINIGMMADVGSLQRLPRLLPDAVLRQMAFCGSTLRAERAAAIGFINEIAADPLAAAMQAAGDIAQRAPLAVSASKRTIAYAYEHSVADSLEHVAMTQAMIWSTSDVMAAIAARAQKGQGDAPAFTKLRALG